MDVQVKSVRSASSLSLDVLTIAHIAALRVSNFKYGARSSGTYNAVVLIRRHNPSLDLAFIWSFQNASAGTIARKTSVNAEYAVTSGSATHKRCGEIHLLTSNKVGISGEYFRRKTFRWDCRIPKELGRRALSEQQNTGYSCNHTLSNWHAVKEPFLQHW